ncbi:tRNA pseudouridine(38-40) synthase TruA [Dethiothermospora halolimnae]|uniref:tRNA pseudouridine(38-40) synthase TruA n=1 Tax=Dethiothermospora halolimnae TaxID=3114390 RepID=UPI003CCB8EE3
MRNIKLTIQYDGTNYYGWQIQPNVVTVQQKVQDAIIKITKEKIKIHGAGRTDRGVHGLGQTASFYTNSNIPADKIKFALNSMLPDDIAIIDSQDMDKNFHARYSAKGKIYKYRIYNNKIRSPIFRNYSYHVPYDINYDKMKKASEYFLGEHDFIAFMASGSKVKDTFREIYDINFEKRDNIIDITFKGNGFLYNMVRIIVGTLLDVGKGKIEGKEILHIIKSKNRNNAGPTAKPQGLYLKKVLY